MKFIKTFKNNFLLPLRFICHSSENGNPDSINSCLDSRLRGNDRKKYSIKNLQPTTYNPASSAGKLQTSPLNLSPRTYKLKPSRGFTLVETLVAISILMVAVASPLTITQKGLASAIYAKDQIIASYLAQDAIEYLRNVSDRNVAGGGNWLAGNKDIKSPCDADVGKKCSVDTSGDTITNCTNGSCSPLKYDGINNIYNNTAADSSSFTRSITVDETVTGVEALITVKISWADKNNQRSLDFNTRIYNWR